MVLGFLVDLTIVYNQSLGSRPWFGNQQTGTAVMGVVPLLIFFNEASINTDAFPWGAWPRDAAVDTRK